MTIRNHVERTDIQFTCKAMYKPGTLNNSNIISAVYSRFSGVFNGGSVYENKEIICFFLLYISYQKKMMIFYNESTKTK